MIGYILLASAIISTCLLTRRRLDYGLIAVFAWGYAYGILRANLASASSYFIFDAALITLYFSGFSRLTANHPEHRTKLMAVWIVVLMAWPIVLVFLPFQPLEVSLVGLRGSIFLLPAILIGMRLKDHQLLNFSRAIAILNIATLGFALGEYFLGVPRFYPHNGVTELLYKLQDVGGGKAFRIPGTFANPASFGGALNASFPFLYGALTMGCQRRRDRCLILSGLVAVLFGVLLSASRTPFILLLMGVIFVGLSGRLPWKMRLTGVLLLTGVASAALTNERLQRFTTLRDTDYVETRIHGSVNRTFLEVFYEYPLGNGLGGGGTSIPYFWENRVRNPVALENEYGRIMLEQSVIGLVLWVVFLIWIFNSRTPFMNTPWREGRRLGWFMCLCQFGSGLIGVGIFTAVPQGLALFLMLGWFSAPKSQVLGRRHAYGASVPPIMSSSSPARSLVR